MERVWGIGLPFDGSWNDMIFITEWLRPKVWPRSARAAGDMETKRLWLLMHICHPQPHSFQDPSKGKRIPRDPYPFLLHMRKTCK